MALRARRNGGNGLDAWPGYVDALSTLLMTIIFVLLVFVLAQGFLSVTLSGRNEALDDARRELANLTSALALERGRAADLQTSLGRLEQDLAASDAARADLGRALAAQRNQTAALERDVVAGNTARDELTRQLASQRIQTTRLEDEARRLNAQIAEAMRGLTTASEANEQMTSRLAATESRADTARQDADTTAQRLVARERELAAIEGELNAARRLLKEMENQIAALDRTVQVDRATIEARVSDAARLTDQIRALTALRDELEKRASDAAVRATTEEQRRRAVEAVLGEQTRLGESARAEVALMTRQISDLRSQLASIAKGLELSEQKVQDNNVTIADLDRRLNAALAQKVEELQHYRSEFFGRLRTLLENRSGIQVVGDRFVFQSEVLFPVGSAELTPAGIGQMTTLAITIKQIANEIPSEVPWILRVDGHTDPQPVRGGQFTSNWELSVARAITVVKMLISAGVPPERLAATGFGEYQPLVAGGTPDAYAKDRRIELRLTDR